MISDKTFQLAKNIGFDLKTCNCGGFPDCICYEVKPTQAVLQKWLREQKNTDVLHRRCSLRKGQCLPATSRFQRCESAL